MEENELAHMYKLWNWIYRCDRCGQKYPHWMINEKDWKKGVKNLRPRYTYGPKKHICKACFECYNPNPKYMTVDEYIVQQDQQRQKIQSILTGKVEVPAPDAADAEFKKLLEEVWALPAQYATPEIYKEQTAWLRDIIEKYEDV